MPRPHRLSFTALTISGMLIAVSVCADPVQKRVRVGLLVGGSVAQRGELEKQLIVGLSDLGYVEGKNLVIERRYANNQPETIPLLAQELAAQKLDAIVTTCTPSTHAAKRANVSVPIVMAAVSDPVASGLIRSLAAPGGNITGRSSQYLDILGKMMEMFRESVPAANPVAILVNVRNPVHALLWREAEAAAKGLKLKLIRIEVSSPSELDAAFEKIATAGVGGVFVLPDDTMMMNFRSKIIALADKNRLPTFFGGNPFVEAGGLMSYGENIGDSYRQTARHLDKVFKGTHPATIPVEQPIRFELLINMRTAKSLGLTIPPTILVRADRLIE